MCVCVCVAGHRRRLAIESDAAAHWANKFSRALELTDESALLGDGCAISAASLRAIQHAWQLIMFSYWKQTHPMAINCQHWACNDDNHDDCVT